MSGTTYFPPHRSDLARHWKRLEHEKHILDTVLEPKVPRPRNNGIATRSKKLLVAPGIATRNKGIATSSFLLPFLRFFPVLVAFIFTSSR